MTTLLVAFTLRFCATLVEYVLERFGTIGLISSVSIGQASPLWPSRYVIDSYNQCYL